MNSYTSENILTLHEAKCEKIDKTTIRTSPDSHHHWIYHFDMSLLSFRIYEDFEADIEIDKSSIGKKTTKIYK